ncbi:MAG: coiled-coil domain-containing protein [Bacteroidia bacterium]
MNQEENIEIQKPKEEKKKRVGFIPWLLLACSITGNGILIYKFNQEKQIIIQKEEVIKTIYVERDNVKKDLMVLKTDFENLHTSNKKLQAAIDEKKAEIEELIKQAEKNKGNPAIIAQLRKETETLRQIMQGYVHTIDSLNTLNKKLIVEKNDVLKKLNEEKNKTSQLSKEKETLQTTIDKASLLTCYGISAQGIDIKKGGKKTVVTTKAKKTDAIRVSYSLGENTLAKAGSKEVFVRIMTPDGKELAKGYDDNYKFTFDGSVGYYAGKTTIDYANKEIGVTTMCHGSDPFVPGNYIIQITCDGVVVGQGTLKLN